jgi:hypothetical protein
VISQRSPKVPFVGGCRSAHEPMVSNGVATGEGTAMSKHVVPAPPPHRSRGATKTQNGPKINVADTVPVASLAPPYGPICSMRFWFQSD